MSHMFQIVTCYNIFLVSGAAVQKPGSLPGTFNYPSYVQHIMGWVDSLPFQTHMTTVVKTVETRTSFFLCVVLFNGTTMGQGVAWKLCVGYYWVKDFQTILSFTCIVALCVWRTGNEPSSLASFPGPPLWNANMEIVRHIHILVPEREWGSLGTWLWVLAICVPSILYFMHQFCFYFCSDIFSLGFGPFRCVCTLCSS